MTSRRRFLQGTGLGAMAAAVSSVAANPSDAPRQQPAANQARGYRPVRTLNGWTLPYVMKNGVKEFHLVAEEIEHEFAPGTTAKCWGYNGSTPGPTIEAVEGDRVRILVTNCLPEHTTIHWHGLLLPSGMDGVGGLNQPQIKPGETFAYEFTLRQHGTHMYHPHADEMTQLAVGMMGMFIIHPQARRNRRNRPRLLLPAPQLGGAPRHVPARSVRDAGVRSVDLQQQGLPCDRPHRCPHGRAGAAAGGQSLHVEPSDSRPRGAVLGHGFRRWPLAAAAVARRDNGDGLGRAAAGHRVRCRAGRLGRPLPYVTPHNERDGPRDSQHAWVWIRVVLRPR